MKLLVSPLAKPAYFADYLQIVLAEFQQVFPGASCRIESLGGQHYVDTDLDSGRHQEVARLSFVQAVFDAQTIENKQYLVPVDTSPGFEIPEELVFAAKYPGKTNELVTQLALNVALSLAEIHPNEQPRLLDPMAGRGTSLFWAARYGLDAVGIEQDAKVIASFQQHTKKQAKLLKLKHSQLSGTINTKSSKNISGTNTQKPGNRQAAKQSGVFQQYVLQGRTIKLVVGDSRDTRQLTQRKHFDVLVADLPYGVQHFTTRNTRNPLDVLTECASQWAECLKPGGAMVLIFNTYQPKRSALIELFQNHGLILQNFSAPHRMSESIVRDLVAFTKL